MFEAAGIVTVILLLLAAAINITAVLFVVWLHFLAYRCGKKSGNITVSLVLMPFLFFGLLHIIGASRSEAGMAFDKKHRDYRNLVNEKLDAEINKK